MQFARYRKSQSSHQLNATKSNIIQTNIFLENYLHHYFRWMRSFGLAVAEMLLYWHTLTSDAFSISNYNNKKKTRKLRASPQLRCRLSLYSISFFFLCLLGLSCSSRMYWLGVIYLTLDRMYDAANCDYLFKWSSCGRKTFAMFSLIFADHLGKVVLYCWHLLNRMLFAFYFNIISIRIDCKKENSALTRWRVDHSVDM